MIKCDKSYWDWENQFLNIETWWENDKHHREDGPAWIWYFKSGQIGYEKWRINDKMHRIDGPAQTEYDEYGKIIKQYYYINGVYYSKEEWEQQPEVIEYKLNQLINKELL